MIRFFLSLLLLAVVSAPSAQVVVEIGAGSSVAADGVDIGIDGPIKAIGPLTTSKATISFSDPSTGGITLSSGLGAILNRPAAFRGTTVSGSVEIQGVLRLTPARTARIEAGDTFDVLTCSNGCSGTFSAVTSPIEVRATYRENAVTVEALEDYSPILLALDVPTVTEGTDTATLTATLRAPAPVNVVVTLSPSGDALAITDDAEDETANQITIPAGRVTGTATATPVDDDVVEDSETITIGIATVAGGGFEAVDQTWDPLVSITVRDDDRPTEDESDGIRFASVQQAVLEDIGRVELVLEIEETPDEASEVTVTLTSGDPADLEGFTSTTITIGGADDDASDDGRYIVTVLVTEDALPEPDETFIFELSVSADEALLAANGQAMALIVVDNDGEAIAMTVPADGLTALAVPVGGLTVRDLAAAAGTDAVFVLDGIRLVALEDDAVLPAGQVVVLDATGEVVLTGSVPADAITFRGTALADSARVLIPVGNPTADAVALSDLEVEGGTLSDVTLVFDPALGAFRPVSLTGLGLDLDALSSGDLEAADVSLGAFGVALLQIVPDDGPEAVTVTVTTNGDASTGAVLEDAAFVPTDGETAVVLAIRPTSSGGTEARPAETPGDEIALRIGVGTDDLDVFDGADVVSPFGPTLAAVGRVDPAALWAALSIGDLEGEVTIPLAVSVPEAGSYEIALARPSLEVDGRPLTVEVFDGTAGTVLEDGAPLAFQATAADTALLSGRFSVRLSLGTSVANRESALEGAPLSVYPNPSAGSATVAVSVLEASTVRVVVYDALGREVAVLHDGSAAAGVLEAEVSGLPAGTYLVRAESEDAVEMRTMTVVR